MKASRIVLPEDNLAIQLNLFEPEKKEKKSIWKFPAFNHSWENWERTIDQANKYLGLDFEYDRKHKASLLGVASGNVSSCRSMSQDMATSLQIARTNGVKFVGHAVVSADKPVYDEYFNVKTSLTEWEDTMPLFYLLNQDFCKSPGKDEDEGSLGFMNLWAMASCYTELPNWKICRGSECYGPCPSHSVFDYCATDAWAGLAGFLAMKKEYENRGLQWQEYRDLVDVSDICYDMELAGINVDRKYVEQLTVESDKEKEKLYPRNSLKYNPRSVDQVISWFGANGVNLKSNDKEEIFSVLEKEKARRGISTEQLDTWLDSEIEGIVPEFIGELYRLYLYKDAGKGYDPWFSEKYFDKNGIIHPRFVPTSTSTGRLSSSGPNFQNIPARGFGALIRGAIIARDKSLQLLKSDFSQLELRMCVSPETKILTSDLSWINAEDVKVGDELIGFDEKQNNGRFGTKYRRSKVLSCGKVLKKTVTIKTDLGNITGADDHFLVVLRKGEKGVYLRTWVKMKDITQNDRIPHIAKPWERDDSNDAGRVAGLLDGEGWINKCGVGFAQAEGPVADLMLHLLRKRGHPVSCWAAKPSKTHKKKHIKAIVTSGMWESARLVGETRPVRLLQKSSVLWEGRRSWGGKNTTSAIIQEIIHGEEKELCAITTSTKTYFANGFFSHNCLYLAGVDPKTISGDAFTWLVERSQGQFNNSAERYNMEVRDIAKRISHAADYLEGFVLFDPKEIETKSIKNMVASGALRLYTKKYMPSLKKDWTFRGKIVGFSGVNLANSLFGATDWDSRKKALEIQEDVYFKNFPMLREWHMSILDAAQDRGYVSGPTGRFLRLYGQPEQDAKIIPAFLGQGTSAVYVLGNMLRFKRNASKIPLMQIHDELVFEIPRTWGNGTAKEFINLMGQENSNLPGFVCPHKDLRGESWLEGKEGKTPEHLKKIALWPL